MMRGWGPQEGRPPSRLCMWRSLPRPGRRQRGAAVRPAGRGDRAGRRRRQARRVRRRVRNRATRAAPRAVATSGSAASAAGRGRRAASRARARATRASSARERRGGSGGAASARSAATPRRRRRAAPPSRVRTRTRRARTRRRATGADSSTGSTCARDHAVPWPQENEPSRSKLPAGPRLTSAPHALGREVARVAFGAVARCGADRGDRPKVAELQLPLRIDEDVARLDVAVDVTARVDVRECVADVAKPARETRQARGERRDVESADPFRAAPGSFQRCGASGASPFLETICATLPRAQSSSCAWRWPPSCHARWNAITFGAPRSARSASHSASAASRARRDRNGRRATLIA